MEARAVAKKEARQQREVEKGKADRKAVREDAREQLRGLREYADEVEIVCDDDDACEACKAEAGKVYPIDKAPLFPFKDCTCEYCECYYGG